MLSMIEQSQKPPQEKVKRLKYKPNFIRLKLSANWAVKENRDLWCSCEPNLQEYKLKREFPPSEIASSQPSHWSNTISEWRPITVTKSSLTIDWLAEQRKKWKTRKPRNLNWYQSNTEMTDTHIEYLKSNASDLRNQVRLKEQQLRSMKDTEDQVRTMEDVSDMMVGSILAKAQILDGL